MPEQLWEITGRVEVEESETTGKRVRRPLAGITVDVRVSEGGRGFASGGRVTTDGRGRFTLRVKGERTGRHVRVLVRFETESGTRMPTPTTARGDPPKDDWYLIFETPSKVTGPAIDIGTRVFRIGEAGDLGDREHVRRATTWYMVKAVLDFLTGEEPGTEFRPKASAAYPAGWVKEMRPFPRGRCRRRGTTGRCGR